jgi:hypothetical protein
MGHETVTKAEICREHGLTRYEFDQLVREGMPVVAGAAHKGGQWQVDPVAVRRWLRRREVREAARRRAVAARAAAWRAEAERQAAARRAAARAAEALRVAEMERRREAELRERALDDCYSACFRLAFRAYGVTTGPGWPDRLENQRFLADWPNDARGGRPAWWAPPPGMAELALAERRRDKRYGEPEPDWRRFLGDYKFGEPWPWRGEGQADG